MDVTEIKKLMEILNKTDVTEITLEAEGTKVLLKKDQNAALKSVAVPSNISEIQDAPEEDIINEGQLISMNVGNFHLKDKSGKNFVNIGDKVTEGQVVGYIESIGIRTDVKSDKDGIVKEILVEDNGKAEFGQVLMVLELD